MSSADKLELKQPTLPPSSKPPNGLTDLAGNGSGLRGVTA